MIEKNITTGDGHTYKVTVTYGPDTGIPEGADLLVSELTEEHEEYASYMERTAEAVDTGSTDLNYVKFLDITIVDEHGDKVTLDAPVDVQIELLDREDRDEDQEETTQIVHFAETEDAVEPEILDNTADGNTVSFRTDSFSVYAVVTYDLGELSGKEIGIIHTNDDETKPTGIALTTSSQNSGTKLAGKSTTVRVDTVGRTENVYVAKNSSISMWSIDEYGGKYLVYISTNQGPRYLKISEAGISLSDDPTDSDCQIQIEQGTSGKQAGRYKLKTDHGVLKLNGTSYERAAATANDDSVWHNFAILSKLDDNDFVTYTAQKASIAENAHEVNNGDLVVVYTRIWNYDKNKYDYYVIDYDGKLVKAYESGDTLSWVGSKVNTMLWDFTEYYWENDDSTATPVPNGYYELQNHQYGAYIAPQTSSGQDSFLSDGTIGIKLNGRGEDEYYTTILAWDGYYYASLKVNEETKALLSSTLSQASDFYFAKMTATITGTTTVSTVSTVDNDAYGISLKMKDYGNTGDLSGGRCPEMTAVLGNTSYEQWVGTKNLLDKYIAVSGGYPNATKTTGHSLGELFSGATEVNHQFLTSTYKETGYFEYDSTRNFAHLITSSDDPWVGVASPNGEPYGVGDFVIYSQIATSSEGNKDTLRHGQFLPYNDIITTFNKDPNGEYYMLDEEGNPVMDEDGNLIAYAPEIIKISTQYQNTTDIHADPLSTLDPAYGEALYEIKWDKTHQLPRVDHFFGMEMSATFIQTASGLDAWGHDLIFEFSGDDDFWLYVDDMLVLDLGGIHSALDGSINFRTGDVIENGVRYTLLQKFSEAYMAKNPNATEDEVDAWLKTKFKTEKIVEEGEEVEKLTSVFKDFTSHDMRMFYLERGAGASNLHMRFNLSEYKNGQVQLEKKVSGTENSKAEFPYQIWYKDSSTHEWMKADGNTSVTDTRYPDTPVKYEDYLDVTVDGHTIRYYNVFYLKDGQTVNIQLPDESTEYYIKECAVDSPATYDWVRINGALAEACVPTPDATIDPGTDAVINHSYHDGPDMKAAGDEGPRQKDFITYVSTVGDRKKVTYENHVNKDAQKSLTITKRLWQDKERTQEITCDRDATRFRYRVYIGMSNGTYTIYENGDYRVKNPDGEYCYGVKDAAAGIDSFVSTGKKDFDAITEGDIPAQYLLGDTPQQRCTFQTGYGTIDNIPAGYTVEIPGLMGDMPYMVLEREMEIPAGYNLIGYTFDSVGQGDLINEDSTEESGERVIHGTITDNKEVTVNNQHGYTLTVEKIWTDAAFMEDHDEIYFAVYRNDTGTPVLISDTVRQLGRTGSSLKWFFPELDAGVTSLNDYQVYEIMLDIPEGSEISVTSSGIVSGYTYDGGTTVTPFTSENISLIDEGGTLIAGGTESAHGDSRTYDYTVSYDRQDLEDVNGEYPNTRKDTVTNARTGIKIVKTDMSGDPVDHPLEGAVFSLSEDGGKTKRFTSDKDGLIVTAYLEPDKEYTLKEISAPYGYQALIDSVTVKVGTNGEVYVDGISTYDSDGPYSIQQVDDPAPANMPTVIIKNKDFNLQARKIDGDSGEVQLPMKDVKFELYKEVFASDANGMPDPNQPMPDYTPINGFDASVLVTDADGIIPGIAMKNSENPNGLMPGTYYLHEAETPSGYVSIDDVYIRITISSTGQVTLQKAIKNKKTGKWDFSAIGNIASVETNETSGIVQITVRNTPKDPVRIRKKQAGTNTTMQGVKFALYRILQVENNQPKEGEVPFLTGETDADGILYLGGVEEGANAGFFLFETETWDGYNLLPGPILITTNNGNKVQAFLRDGSGTSGRPLDCKQVKDADGNTVWEITVENNPGIALPNTGGPGTRIFRILGITMLGYAGVCLVMRRKRIRI